MKTHPCFFHFVRFSIWFLFLGGLVGVTGCTTPGSTMEVKQTLLKSPGRYKIVAIDVTSRDADFGPGYVALLDNSLINDLRNSGKFERVYDTSLSSERDADLKLSVLVEFTLFYNVKHIEGSVTLTDAAGGKTLATASINAHSEFNLFMGGQMTNAIAKLSDQVVGFVTQQ
jgi:hypothetical protein